MNPARCRFEYRLLQWAEEMSFRWNGDRRAMFVGLRDDGGVRRVYFAPAAESFDGDRRAALAQTYRRWFSYAPGPEAGTGALAWSGVAQPLAERWIGAALGREDFVDVRDGGPRPWPEAWQVVVR